VTEKNAAAEISETAQEAVKELMKEGYGTNQNYILSYGGNYSYEAWSPYDNEVFEEKFRSLAGEDIDYDFFIRVKNGEVEYTAVSKSWCNIFSTIGTYPPSPAKELTYYGSGGDNYKVDNLIHLRERFIPCD
jgi:hypothetical protein